MLREAGVERSILVGHSDGGTIALLYAAAFPAARPRSSPRRRTSSSRTITLAGIRAAGVAYATTDLPRRLARYHGDKTDGIFKAWHDGWRSPEFRAGTSRPSCRTITCPALVLQGADDEYGTPAQVAAIARGVSGPVESVLLPGCGHTPHQQAADRVLDLIADFVGRL